MFAIGRREQQEQAISIPSSLRLPIVKVLTQGGRDAELWELAALCSAPGAGAQIAHA